MSQFKKKKKNVDVRDERVDVSDEFWSLDRFSFDARSLSVIDKFNQNEHFQVNTQLAGGHSDN